MLPYSRSRNQNQRQDLVRSDSDFDLSFPLGYASPWQMMRRMQEDMDRVFGQFIDPRNSTASRGSGQSLQTWAPHIDISETDQEYHIEADLPGVRQEDIDVRVQDGMLTLRAQMQQGEDQPQTTQATSAQNQNAPQNMQGQATDQEHVARDQNNTQDRDGTSPKMENQNVQSNRRYHQRERRMGYFERSMTLPPNIDENKITAQFKNGVLTLCIPKQAQAPQSHRIQIQGDQSTTSTANTGSQQTNPNMSSNQQTQTTPTPTSNTPQPVGAGAQSKP
jgi:HSP20 family protein